MQSGTYPVSSLGPIWDDLVAKSVDYGCTGAQLYPSFSAQVSGELKAAIWLSSGYSQYK